MAVRPSKDDEGSETSFNFLLIKFQADWGSSEMVTLGSVERAKSLWLASTCNSAILKFWFWWKYTAFMINFIFCKIFWLHLRDPSQPVFVLSLYIKLYLQQLFYLLHFPGAGTDFFLYILSLRCWLILQVMGFLDCAGIFRLSVYLQPAPVLHNTKI